MSRLMCPNVDDAFEDSKEEMKLQKSLAVQLTHKLSSAHVTIFLRGE